MLVLKILQFFLQLSTGEKVENPKYLKNSLNRLKVPQKRVSRKVKGSKNREKARLLFSKLHKKIITSRDDFQHKFSSKLISENQAIALETLNVKGIQKNHCLAQAISDSAWSSFVTKLEYKGRWEGLGDLFSKEKGMNQEASPSKRSRKAKNSGRSSSRESNGNRFREDFYRVSFSTFYRQYRATSSSYYLIGNAA